MKRPLFFPLLLLLSFLFLAFPVSGQNALPAENSLQETPTPTPSPGLPSPTPQPTPPPRPTPIPGPPQPSPAPVPPPMPAPEVPPSPQPESKIKAAGENSNKSSLAMASEPDDASFALPPEEEPAPYVPQNVTKKKGVIDPLVRIKKVYNYRNEDSYQPAKNDALMFDKDYWSYGAITGNEIYNTHGQYFVITWVNKGPRADFTTRFEYRQVNTKSKIRTLTLSHPAARGATRSAFAVTGNAYKVYGPVYAWRFTVLRGDAIVAEDESFIW